MFLFILTRIENRILFNLFNFELNWINHRIIDSSKFFVWPFYLDYSFIRLPLIQFNIETKGNWNFATLYNFITKRNYYRNRTDIVVIIYLFSWNPLHTEKKNGILPLHRLPPKTKPKKRHLLPTNQPPSLQHNLRRRHQLQFPNRQITDRLQSR